MEAKGSLLCSQETTVLGQMYYHVLSSHFFKIHFNITLPATSSSFFHKSFPTKPCMHLLSHPSCPSDPSSDTILTAVKIYHFRKIHLQIINIQTALHCQIWLNFRWIAKVHKLFTLFTTILIKCPLSHVFINSDISNYTSRMFNQISIWCLDKHICTHNTGKRKQIPVTHLIAWRNVSWSRTGSKCPVPSPLLSATVLQASRSTNSSGSNGSCTKSKGKQHPWTLWTTL